ncbi:MAG: hypothetical protein ACTHKL_16440 [Streptosporangiaceae bacterium]
MSAFHVIVGCAGVICGIWGFADVVRHLRASRAGPGPTSERPRKWPLVFRSVLPFTTGVVLIANAADTHVGSWVLDVTAGVLLIWLTVEELGARLRSWQQGRANASRG